MLELPSLFGAEQQLLFATAVRALRDLPRVPVAAADVEHESRAAWLLAIKLGWMQGCLAVSDEASSPLISACTLAEAHGYAGVGSPLFSAVIAGQLLLSLGVPREDQRVADLESGRTLTSAGLITIAQPPRAKSRVTAPAKIGRLEPSVVLAPFAAFADFLLLPAFPGDGVSSPSLRLASTSDPAIDRQTLRTSGGTALSLVRMRRADVGEPVAAGATAQTSFSYGRLLGAMITAAELAGIGRAALELTLEYAKNRVQFGRPIGSFQAVHHHFADMLRDLTAVRLLTAQAASRLDRGLPAQREASMAKAKAAQAIPLLLRTAHQITGGAGFYQDYPLEGYLRRAIDAAALYGTAIEHRRILAKAPTQPSQSKGTRYAAAAAGEGPFVV
ncbi:MAG: acyl-CoA dehydrogenase family protein [Dehalococcoidia bacterium]